MDGNRIPPNEYERKLPGSIVEVHFCMVYHYIKKSERVSFTADVRLLKVLRPPSSPIRSPIKLGKRKLHQEQAPNKRRPLSSAASTSTVVSSASTSTSMSTHPDSQTG